MTCTRFVTRALRPPILFLTCFLLPLAAAAQSPAKGSGPTAKVDLNTASMSDLEALPGVGAATAKKIVAGRPYASVEDLAKAGVPTRTIQSISGLVTVSGAKAAAPPTPSPARAPASSATASPKAGAGAAPVDLNTASMTDLEALPGVGPATAKKIVGGRPYAAVDDLAKAGVPAKTIQSLAGLVTVGATRPPSPTPTVPPPPSPVRPSTPPSATTPATSTTTATPTAGPPPVKGMVWVNTATKVYHHEGDRYYGKTKEGKYMTEADAIKAGYREAKSGTSEKK